MSDASDRHEGNGLRRLAKAFYARLPAPLARALYPLIYCYRAYDEVRPRFWIAESQGRDDGLSISVLCAAGTWDRSSLLRQVLGEPYREHCVGRAWLWNLSRVNAEKGKHCCGVVVRVRPGFRRFLGSRTWLNVPAWVLGEVDLPLARRILASGTVKNDLRKIRKYALTSEVTHDPQQFDDFYHHMYVPHAKAVFGDGARIWPQDVLRKHFENGELLLVKKDGRHIAGGLISYRQAEPSLVVLGVRDGENEFVRMGAVGAKYHFTFRHLADKGFTKASLGKSRAFLHDGVLRYKKKLGMRLVGPSDGYFYLRVDRDTNASRAFLKANPLILERDGKLCAAVFTEQCVDRFVAESLPQFCKDHFHDGLSEVLIVPFDSMGSSGKVPPEWANKVTVHSASDVLGFG